MLIFVLVPADIFEIHLIVSGSQSMVAIDYRMDAKIGLYDECQIISS